MTDISMELQAIHDQAADYASGQQVAALSAGDLKKQFCERWPQVKDGLELVRTFVPAVARIAIDVLVAAGDGAHSTACPAR